MGRHKGGKVRAKNFDEYFRSVSGSIAWRDGRAIFGELKFKSFPELADGDYAAHMIEAVFVMEQDRGRPHNIFKYKIKSENKSIDGTIIEKRSDLGNRWEVAHILLDYHWLGVDVSELCLPRFILEANKLINEVKPLVTISISTLATGFRLISLRKNRPMPEENKYMGVGKIEFPWPSAEQKIPPIIAQKEETEEVDIKPGDEILINDPILGKVVAFVEETFEDSAELVVTVQGIQRKIKADEVISFAS